MVRKAGLWCALMSGIWMAGGAPAFAADTAAVIETYADIAHAKYEDALTTAEALEKAIDALIAKPTEDNLKAARTAWLAARDPYQQTEGYRFGNPIVDDWEGKVNAWPLDEGLIDYVAEAYGTESDDNPLYTANVIANTGISFGGETVDTSKITKELLADKLHEAADSEANVATGYHAIEFLLWGQDLHGTEAGAGERPFTDYSTEANAKRRGQYLDAATDLLVTDLEEMVANWQEGGAARTALGESGLATILTGMGSLSFGELAGERMKLGLLLHDPEEEHDCFSDNTYISHLNDAIGIQNVYLGKYTRVDGSVVEGPSISELIASKDAAVDTELKALLADTVAKMELMKTRGDTVEKYDQMIAEGNAEGHAVVQAAIDGLIAQTRGIERAVALLELGDTVTIEQSDSLTNPDAVFQ